MFVDCRDILYLNDPIYLKTAKKGSSVSASIPHSNGCKVGGGEGLTQICH